MPRGAHREFKDPGPAIAPGGDSMDRQARSAQMVAERNDKVLEAALTVAQACGMRALTRDTVAATAGVSVGSVNNAFGTMDNLRAEVMRQAVAREILPIIAAGLAEGSPIARNASPALRDRALQSIAS